QHALAACGQGDPHGFVFDELSATRDQFHSCFLEQIEVGLPLLLDHLLLATIDAGHVDLARPDQCAEIRSVLDERRDLGAVNDVLAGQASHVRTCTADRRSFDDHGSLAERAQCPGDVLACFAAADHEILVIFCAHGVLSTSHTPAKTRRVKNAGSMRKVPNFASKEAVGLAATTSATDLPSFFSLDTRSRTATSMSRNSVS